MGARRRRADEQRLGDLVVAEPAGDERDDLALAVGQHASAVGVDRAVLGRAANSAISRRVTLGRAAPRRRRVPDRPQQVGRLGVLQEEPGRAGADRLEHVLVEVERGQHHDVHRREGGIGDDRAGRRQPVDVRHPDVHHDDVGQQLPA